MYQNVPASNANCRTKNEVNSLQQNQYGCSSCSSRTFSTYRDLSQYNRYCTKHLNAVSISSRQPVTISERVEVTNVFSPVTLFVYDKWYSSARWKDNQLFKTKASSITTSL